MADTFRYKRIRLETVSESSSDISDTESVYSIQGRETELVRDTSDTSNNFEFEVQDIAVSESVFLSSSEDPDIQDIAELGAVVASLAYQDNFDIASQADTSEENSTSPTSNSDVDPELPRLDYLDFQHCIICKTEDKDISYPYCKGCFSKKKTFFPPRPEKNKRRKLRTIDKGNDKKSISGNLSDGGKSSSVGSGTKFSSQESSFDEGSYNLNDKALCKICCIRKMDGVFVHGSTGHMHSCFRCAIKTWKNIGVCPLCRKKCKDVIKLFNPFEKD